MKLLPRFIAVALLMAVTAVSLSALTEMPVGRFSSGDLTGWAARSFKGETHYSFVTEGQRTVLHARSRAGASGYYRKMAVDPQDYPVIRWSWKVAHTIVNENPRTKDGDDFAARVYVVFPGFFFWQTRAICYVWSERLPRNTVISSPYTDRIKIVAVESGSGRIGQWTSEERNYRDDYRQFFGDEPDRLAAIGLMTDTDNTGAQAESWYGDIVLARSPALP